MKNNIIQLILGLVLISGTSTAQDTKIPLPSASSEPVYTKLYINHRGVEHAAQIKLITIKKPLDFNSDLSEAIKVKFYDNQE